MRDMTSPGRGPAQAGDQPRQGTSPGRGPAQAGDQPRQGIFYSNFSCVPKPGWGHPVSWKGHLRRSEKGTLSIISIAHDALYALGVSCADDDFLTFHNANC